MSGYPFLTLTGTARERGYQYGSQVPELIKKNIALALFNHLGDFGRTFQKGTSSSIEAPFRA